MVAIVVEAWLARQPRWQHNDGDHDDGDHGVMPVTMEIKSVLGRWRSKAQVDGHIMSLMICM